MRGRLVFVAAVVAGVALVADLGAQGRGGGQRGRGGQPARDARAVPAGTGMIAGRVLTTDTNRPIKRARVLVTGGGQPHAASTDEEGRYRITGLPAATYRVTATKTGFVDGTFGQRRAMRDGSPIELADNQQITDADVRLARGGVITGHIFDEDGEPLARSVVTVLRSQYLRGEKQLVPAGADQSDDRGQYRIFGLPPGEYFVSATAGGVDRVVAQLVGRGIVEAEPSESTGYAPTYYPGVISTPDAGRLKLAAAQEITGIDFPIQVVPLATVRGIVTGANAIVLLVPDSGVATGAAGRGGGGGRAGLAGMLGAIAGGQNFRATTEADGSFAIRNVTPGKYTIVARTVGDGGDPRMALQQITVSGQEVTVALNPAGGSSIAGTVTLEATATAVPKGFSGFRVNAASLDPSPIPGRAGRGAEAGDAGQFSIPGVFPGYYVIRASAPRGWTMKSVYVDGRDVTDQPIEMKGTDVTGVNVIFTDRIASLAGVVRDSKGAGVAGFTVIVFPQDANRWQPQSRQIVTARTGKDGDYRFANIPAGDYLVVAVDDVEQGEWFDPAFLEQISDGATKVTVADGEQRTQDLKAPSGS